MKKGLNRRDFIGRASVATFTGALLGGCIIRDSEGSEDAAKDPVGSTMEEEIEKNRKMPRDLVMKMLDQKVDHYMQLSYHCAQSSFMVLKEQFGLDGDEVVKALTPLAGIAERGETCGAVTGPLMAFGLIYGRGENRLDDWETYRESLVPSGKFCTQFETEFGSTMCHDVQKVKFGRCFRLIDPEELREFQKAGATEHCSAVVRTAVRMAANIILDDT
ncbi:MAG: C_GCAxxG_C_C family protein [Bacteroidales bacterium]|nr:C_GCAxxG_C_C family protein [Bacteroidales bacterium]